MRPESQHTWRSIVELEFSEIEEVLLPGQVNSASYGPQRCLEWKYEIGYWNLDGGGDDQSRISTVLHVKSSGAVAEDGASTDSSRDFVDRFGACTSRFLETRLH